jgi:hypothetical protein
MAPDLKPQAAIYTDLAFHSVLRARMCKRSPAPELVSSWIDRGLELTESDVPAGARSLVARAWRPPHSPAAAREALDLAERLGDVELRSLALHRMTEHGFVGGDFEEWHRTVRYLELLDPIEDPDHRATALMQACFAAAAAGVGRIADARQLARQHDEVTPRLTRHHHLHGVVALAMVEELAAHWEAIRRLKPRAEHSV